MSECPYAERKGLAVFCKLANKKVSPLRYPCFSSHWQKCPIYREMAPKQEEESKAAEVSTEGASSGVDSRVEKRISTSRATATSAPTPRSIGKGFKRPEEAKTCYECIFYSELTGMCLKLKIRVDDPNNPPCKRGST